MADSKKPAAKADVKSLSSDAEFSTYKVNTDLKETVPPTGQHVFQELGTPKES